MTGAPEGAAGPDPPPDAGFEPHPHGHPRAMERVEKALEHAAHRVVAPAERPGIPAWVLPTVKLVLPLLLILSGLALLPVIFPHEFPRFYAFLGQYFLVPGGLETAIPVALGFYGLDAIAIVAVVLYVTMAGTLFMVWNLEHLDRVPRLGRWIARLEEKAHKAYKKRPWMERSAFWGIALFVLLPINGTGAVPGTIIGKMLGLHKGLVWLAVTMGSTTRVTLWTLASLGVLKALF